jgi:hypothetical protein
MRMTRSSSWENHIPVASSSRIARVATWNSKIQSQWSTVSSVAVQIAKIVWSRLVISLWMRMSWWCNRWRHLPYLRTRAPTLNGWSVKWKKSWMSQINPNEQEVKFVRCVIVNFWWCRNWPVHSKKLTLKRWRSKVSPKSWRRWSSASKTSSKPTTSRWSKTRTNS